MRLNAKLVAKHEMLSGTSQRTGQQWRSQDIDFQLYDKQSRLTNVIITLRCTNAMLLDAPAVCVGATGVVGCWIGFNGNFVGTSFSGFEPQTYTEGETRDTQLTEIDKAWLNVIITQRAYNAARDKVKALRAEEDAKRAALLQAPVSQPVQAPVTNEPKEDLPF